MPVPVDAGYVEHLATNRYFDRTFDCDAVKVLPGEYFVTTADMLLVTVLGSCVTACIRDRDKGLGGMNHFMLPDCADSGVLSSSAALRFRLPLKRGLAWAFSSSSSAPAPLARAKR